MEWRVAGQRTAGRSHCNRACCSPGWNLGLDVGIGDDGERSRRAIKGHGARSRQTISQERDRTPCLAKGRHGFDKRIKTEGQTEDGATTC